MGKVIQGKPDPQDPVIWRAAYKAQRNGNVRIHASWDLKRSANSKTGDNITFGEWFVKAFVPKGGDNSPEPVVIKTSAAEMWGWIGSELGFHRGDYDFDNIQWRWDTSISVRAGDDLCVSVKRQNVHADPAPNPNESQGPTGFNLYLEFLNED